MPRKTYGPEQIIGLLREAEVALGQGRTVGEVCRDLGITSVTYYRWRKAYGGLKLDQAKRLKELERENARLRNRGPVMLVMGWSPRLALSGGMQPQMPGGVHPPGPPEHCAGAWESRDREAKLRWRAA